MARVMKTAKGVAKNAHGRPVKDYGLKDANGAIVKRIGYEFSWPTYQTPQDMLDNQDGLSLEEQKKVRNIAEKTKARQAANAAAILAAGIVAPNSENDSQVRLKLMYDGLKGKYLASGMSPEDAHTKAREKAAEFLEEDWDDETDEDE